MISVYIPVYNSKSWCESFAPVPGFRYIASDNNSNDGTPEILRSKGVDVIRQPVNLGRIGNWEFCVDHFVKSGEQWMKWLFAGDILRHDSSLKLKAAIKNNPSARMIISEYEIKSAGGTNHWKMFPQSRMVLPAESMRLAAERGNWFGSPIGCCLHRDAVVDGFCFGSDEWTADMQFCLNIAEKYPVFYLSEIIGDFNVLARKYFLVHSRDLFSRAEEILARRDAADKYRRITGRDDVFCELLSGIRAEFETAVTMNVCSNWDIYPGVQDAVIGRLPGCKMAKALAVRLRARLFRRKT